MSGIDTLCCGDVGSTLHGNGTGPHLSGHRGRGLDRRCRGAFRDFRPTNNGTAKCRVAIIAHDSTCESKEIGVPVTIVTKPGRHSIGAHLTGLREGMIRDEHVFEAGKKRRVDSTGRSKRTVKIEAEEV